MVEWPGQVSVALDQELDRPVALKEIVYEMRFDPVSADYADFGPFVTGLLAEPAEALRAAGLPGA